MIHPLVNNLDQFTVHELEEKIMSLNNKYFQTNNEDLQNQILLVRNMYQTEMKLRYEKELELYFEKTKGRYGKLINIS